MRRFLTLQIVLLIHCFIEFKLAIPRAYNIFIYMGVTRPLHNFLGKVAPLRGRGIFYKGGYILKEFHWCRISVLSSCAVSITGKLIQSNSVVFRTTTRWVNSLLKSDITGTPLKTLIFTFHKCKFLDFTQNMYVKYVRPAQIGQNIKQNKYW